MAKRVLVVKDLDGNNVTLWQNAGSRHHRPDIIAYYEKKAASGDASDLYLLAEMHMFAFAGPRNYPAAAKLLRRAAEKNHPYAQESLFILETWCKTSSAHDLTHEIVNYHAYIASHKIEYLRDIKLKNYIIFLAEDDLLTAKDQLNFLITALTLLNINSEKLNIHTTNVKAQQLLGRYYYQQAQVLIYEKWPYIKNPIKKDHTLQQAFELLKKVPPISELRGRALCEIGLHIYQAQKKHNHLQAFERAKPYFKEAIELNDRDAKMYYKNMLGTILDKGTQDKKQSIVVLEKEVDQLIDYERQRVEIIKELAKKIKSPSWAPILRSDKVKKARLQALLEKLEKANKNTSPITIIENWEKKNLAIITQHRNRFFSIKRDGVKTSTEVLVDKLKKKCSPT